MPSREWMRPTEDSILLSVLAKKIGVAYGTVLEWANEGRRGVKLRVCQLPSGMASSMNEYRDFLDRLNEVVES